MKFHKKLALIVIAAAALTACGGGGGSAGSGTPATSISGFSGQAQKGPLIFGSLIWASELDVKLNPTGKTYLAETTDDLGNFAVSANLTSNLVQLVGQGYYMDELTGSLSSSPITLTAIADLSVDSTPTINILTTLAAPRIKKLILSGKSYSDALNQAQSEVLAAFKIDSTKIDNLSALYAMQINGTSDQDAALLATSTVISQMSTDAALAGSSQASQMSFFLSRIASDISNNGVLTNASIITARDTASTEINLSMIRTNVETYYAARGLTMVAPKFEEWIDKDGSGVLPKRIIAASGITPTNVTGAEALQLISSNDMTVSGLGNGVSSSAVVDFSNALLKNSNAVSGTTATVQNGDVLAIRRTSGVFGQSVTTNITVGSTSTNWVVTTRTPSVAYVSNTGCGPAGYPGDNAAVYHALPISPSQALTGKYIGVAMPGSASTSMSIYSDNSNQPGTAIVTSTNKNAFFPSSLTLPITGGGTKNDFGGGNHYYLSSSGVSLSANTLYWVVVRFSSATDPGSYKNASVPGGMMSASQRMVSSDGVTWTRYNGQANCRYSDQIPEVWITD